MQVINWRSTLRIPPQARLSAEVSDLIVQLCRGPEDRLGANGADEIKAHAFFRGADFSGDPRQQAAPYVPTIAHATDTSNFDPVQPEKRWSSGDDGEDGPSDGPGGLNTRHPEHAFYEFTFRRFFDDNGHPYSCPKPIEDQEDQEDLEDQEEEATTTARDGPTQDMASASRDLVYV